MKIDKTNQQQYKPTFQMKYMFKKYWQPDILKALEESKLVKDIDKRYPDARAYFDSYVTDQRVNNTSVIIKLDKKTTFKISALRKYINNPKEDFPAIDKFLIERIKNASFQDVLLSVAKNKKDLNSAVETLSKAVIFNKVSNLKIKNKYNWNLNVLDEFMGSKLAKDLGENYPGSKISYKYTYYPYNDNSAAIIIENANKQKSIIEASSQEPIDDLIKRIKSNDIEDVKKDFEDYQKIKEDSRSPLIKSLRKLFHIDK